MSGKGTWRRWEGCKKKNRQTQADKKEGELANGPENRVRSAFSSLYMDAWRLQQKRQEERATTGAPNGPLRSRGDGGVTREGMPFYRLPGDFTTAPPSTPAPARAISCGPACIKTNQIKPSVSTAPCPLQRLFLLHAEQLAPAASFLGKASSVVSRAQPAVGSREAVVGTRKRKVTQHQSGKSRHVRAPRVLLQLNYPLFAS